MKNFHFKPVVHVIFNCEILKYFYLNSENDEDISYCIYYLMLWWNLRDIYFGKKEPGIFSFEVDMVVAYSDNLRESNKKVVGIIREFAKVADYKINVIKPIDFLYTSNDQLEKM